MSCLLPMALKHIFKTVSTHPRLSSFTRLAGSKPNLITVKHHQPREYFITSSTLHAKSIFSLRQKNIDSTTSLRSIKSINIKHFHASATANQPIRKPICEFCEKEPTHIQHHTKERKTSNSFCKTCFDNYQVTEVLNPEFVELRDMVGAVLATPTVNEVDLTYPVDKYVLAFVEMHGFNPRFAIDLFHEKIVHKFTVLLEVKACDEGYVCGRQGERGCDGLSVVPDA